MALPNNQINQHNINAPYLVDEVSDIEFYIGKSQNTSNPSEPKWRIQKIWKIGTIWNFGFPDGDQNYKFKWSERFGYTYK
jgi:hypothetical protein